MYGINIDNIKSNFSKYTEVRIEKNSQYKISIVNGIVMINYKNINSGVNARVYDNGVWGFAANWDVSEESIKNVIRKAESNASFLKLNTPRKVEKFEHKQYCNENFKCQSSLKVSQNVVNKKQCTDFGKNICAYIKSKYRDIGNVIIDMLYENTEKEIICSDNIYWYGILPRTTMNISLITEKDGKPIEISKKFGGLGNIQDNFNEFDKLYKDIDVLCKYLIDKKNGVYAKSGEKQCVLSSYVSGLMAHEAIGHMLEADTIMNGPFKFDSIGKKIANSKLTLVDFAHTAFGKNCPIPIYVDDEGTKCEDVIAIENGILKEFMCNKEMANVLGIKPKGNARLESFSNDPVISMRNTCIMPSDDKVGDMIASIEDGYYLIIPTSAQVDINSQFITGIKCGYEIKNGKIGNAILNTSISGDVKTFLNSISMIGDDFKWLNGGICTKKIQMRVGMGSPSIKCTVNIGGV